MNPIESEMERLFSDVREQASPGASDRARLSETLRARLGTHVVDGEVGVGFGASDAARSGVAPAAGAGSARPGVLAGSAAPRTVRWGWLGAVVGAGVVMGALGLIVGHAWGRRAEPVLLPAGAPSAATGVLNPPAMVEADSAGADGAGADSAAPTP